MNYQRYKAYRLSLLLLVLLCYLPRYDSFTASSFRSSSTRISRISNDGGCCRCCSKTTTSTASRSFGVAVRSTYNNDQAIEAVQSLVDFHQGIWHGTATSFTVTNDVMAGIVQRKVSIPYTTSVRFSSDRTRGGGEHVLYETMTIIPTSQDNNKDGGVATVPHPTFQRTLSLSNSNMDVDSVDASYSLDMTRPDFPVELSGTGTKQQQQQFLFGIEHCLATSDNTRSRCFVFYGADIDGVTTEQLNRIVICHERRLGENDDNVVIPDDGGPPTFQLTTQDLIEMQSDIDRLVDKITGNGTKQPPKRRLSENNTGVVVGENGGGTGTNESHDAAELTPHTISLLEISSGIWVGDSIIRDIPTVRTSPVQPKGFGSTASSSNRIQQQQQQVPSTPFGSWSVGVQKVAWRWMWNFDEEIRAVIDVGRTMGAQLVETLPKSMAGSVCVNEGLSRRIPAEERMVYIDWESDNVAFLCGSVSIQVPRFLNFDHHTRRLRSFYTEFAVYQATTSSVSNNQQPSMMSVPPTAEKGDVLPEVISSKISRVYNYEGKLKQGITSFFTLQRFGAEDDA